jgi:DNA-binding MarR family transcriptional regulator
LREKTMPNFDDIIHQPLRLRIMAALCQLNKTDAASLDFSQLKAVTGATDGNLGAHIITLEKAGYVTPHKSFIDKRPNTAVKVTEKGRKAFEDHVAELRALVGSQLT